MKLRNKKTGDRGVIACWDNDYVVVYPVNEKWEAYSDEKYVYHSLSEIIEDWEDVKEPLIKDEKIRKAVRAWAEANHAKRAKYNGDEWELVFNDFGSASIQFNSPLRIEDGFYTIEELCGSEEIEILEPTYTTIEEKAKAKENN